MILALPIRPGAVLKIRSLAVFEYGLRSYFVSPSCISRLRRVFLD